jgi:uncharacterized membrane protein (UPF0127 family)
MKYLASLLLSAALAACAPSASDAAMTATKAEQTAPAVHPVSGLLVVPLRIEQGGKSHTFSVEVAQTQPEQARGLMFRPQLGADEGMLFPLQRPRVASFWMHNTVISLDIIFIGIDGRIINIAANTVPYSETPIMAQDITYAVLELNGGRAAQLGIRPGALVKW